MPQLICNDLTLGYDSRVISENINFQVNKGDYLCIVGENGSGKSTLMKTLLGLQPPLSGQVVFADGFSRKQIGYLPQQTPVQKDFPASVEEIVLSGFLGSSGLRPFYSRSQKKRSPSDHDTAWNLRQAFSILPGTFRRSTAKSSTCKGTMCY